MNDEYNTPECQGLESPLDVAVQAALAEPLPDEAIERVKLRARQLANIVVAPSRKENSFGRRRPVSRVVIGSLIAAVALFAIVLGSNLMLDRAAASAFAQAVEKVRSASTVQFTITERLGRHLDIDGRIFLDGNRLRLEQLHGMLVQIADIDQKRALYLDTHRKLAQSTEMNAQLAERLANPVDQLRRAKSSEAESIGEEFLNGHRSFVYRLRKVRLFGVDGDMLVWVDSKTGLPIKFVIRDASPQPKSEIQFDDFVWNQPFEAALFSLDVPAGFQTGVVMIEPKPRRPTTISKASLDAPNVKVDGILSRDRVPGRIVWSTDGTAVTALMRDPESVAALQRQPDELRQWDVATGKLRWAEEVDGANSLAATVDGKTLATATSAELQLRDAASGQITRKWETDAFPPQLAFSPDAKTLAAATAVWKRAGEKVSGGVQIWDVAQGRVVRSVVDDQPTTFVAYSVDGKYVASSSNMGPVRLWDSATGEFARVFPGTRCTFSPDGRTIACTSMEPAGEKNHLAKVNLYDLASASPVKSLVSEKATTTSWLLGIAFSPSGRLLAAANWDGTVTLWEVETGERKLTITDHSGGVHTAVFSPDGTMLATGSEDKTLRLRKLSTDLIRSTSQKK